MIPTWQYGPDDSPYRLHQHAEQVREYLASQGIGRRVLGDVAAINESFFGSASDEADAVIAYLESQGIAQKIIRHVKVCMEEDRINRSLKRAMQAPALGEEEGDA